MPSAELDAIDGIVVGRGQQVALHLLVEVVGRVLVEAVGREGEARSAPLDLGAVVTFDRAGGGDGRLGVAGVERVGRVGPGRVGVAAVEPRARDADQRVGVGVAGLDQGVGAGAGWSVRLRRRPSPRCRRCRSCTGRPTRWPRGRRGCGTRRRGSAPAHRAPAAPGSGRRCRRTGRWRRRCRVGPRRRGWAGRTARRRARPGRPTARRRTARIRAARVVRGRALVRVAAVGDRSRPDAGSIARPLPVWFSSDRGRPRTRSALVHPPAVREATGCRLVSRSRSAPEVPAPMRGSDGRRRSGGCRRAGDQQPGHQPAGHSRVERAVVIAVGHRPHEGDRLARRDRVLVGVSAGDGQNLDRAVHLRHRGARRVRTGGGRRG